MNRRQSGYPYCRTAGRRRGSIMMLCTALLGVLAIVGAFAINLSYAELARTELRVSTDAAAKAAAIRLGKTQSINSARATAINVAARHQVGGVKLGLTAVQIQFGRSTKMPAGGYEFTVGAQPFNSIRIVAARDSNSSNGAINSVFGSFFGNSTVSIQQQAIAMRADSDVCLVLDRSGSMAWDLTNAPFSYPDELHDKSAIQNYFQPPHETLSRWAALEKSVEAFTALLQSRNVDVRLGLVTYASDYTFGVFTSQAVAIDSNLTADLSVINTKMRAYDSIPLIGDTNIGAGLSGGITALNNTNFNRPLTGVKAMVLMSDGLKTQGPDPLTVASQAFQSKIAIHTISYSSQADRNLMRAIANATGGQYYHAPDAATLRAAFVSIAESLPAVLIQ